jgi:hypothetical protein
MIYKIGYPVAREDTVIQRAAEFSLTMLRTSLSSFEPIQDLPDGVQRRRYANLGWARGKERRGYASKGGGIAGYSLLFPLFHLGDEF